MKGTKACWGYFGCDKCVIEGEHDGKRVFFRGFPPLRTDSEFRRGAYSEHVLRPSPFLCLPLDMIRDFPLDPMHLIYEGIVAKCLRGLTTARLPHKLSSAAIQRINDDLNSLSACIPSDFPRKPRSLGLLGLWKATEFRLFILYLAPVLRPHFSDAMYNVFVSLHPFVFLLSHPDHHKYCVYAESLAEWFVQECEIVWGREFLVYTVHALLHLPNEVRRFGPLEEFSCFWGENFIHSLGKKCRGSRFSLQQVVKRVLERNVTLGQKVDEQPTDLFSKPLPIPDILIEGIEIYGCFEKVTLSTRRTSVSTANEKDRYIYNDEGVVLQVSHIFSTDVGTVFYGRKFNSITPIYHDTVTSTLVNIAVVNDLSHSSHAVRPRQLLCKAILLRLRNCLYAFPIIHTYS